eukprot:TRINITY_DN90753_c0_g1_i1.p1 TRINITY_DN90753_c0_g1~~TRINITY_DN90753_c0_g1_i1.p1  ORF type:complete len:283 (+),score=47.42 TRINITY_DN90753_c0_g1_i1:119-967(+)
MSLDDELTLPDSNNVAAYQAFAQAQQERKSMHQENEEAKKYRQALRAEYWLQHFCNDEEVSVIMQWLREEGIERPEGVEERIAHAKYLRTRGNEFYKLQDGMRSLRFCLGALHCMDFTPQEQGQLSDVERQQTADGLVSVLGNLALVFLRRRDLVNAIRAATAGLKITHKLPKEVARQRRAKLFYRRALARGEQGPSYDLESARDDLKEAALLEPQSVEIRHCLENCKALMRGDPLPYPSPEDDVDATGEAQEGQASDKQPGLLFGLAIAIPLLAVALRFLW